MGLLTNLRAQIRRINDHDLIKIKEMASNEIERRTIAEKNAKGLYHGTNEDAG